MHRSLNLFANWCRQTFTSLAGSRRAGIISVLIAASALSACSAIKLAYNQAPELGYWYADGYFDLNDAQSLRVKAELAKLHGWHRQTQLPAYAQTLTLMAEQLPQEVSATQACALTQDVREKVIAVIDYSLPAAADLALTLQTAQLAGMESKFAKSNKKFKGDYLEGSEKSRLEKRKKLVFDRVEMLYGNLAEPQYAVLNRHVEQSSFDAARVLAETQRRQADILSTLQGIIAKRVSSDAARQALRGVRERAFASPDARYREYAEKMVQENCKNFSELHASTTPAQRQKAVENVRAYERDFKVLAAQSAQ